MAVKVKNLRGTADRACTSCGTWLKHWEKLSGKKADECTACKEKATVGGHVKKANSTDDSHYITPLCDGCNKRNDEFDAFEPLVSARKCD